ncbi:uncharacterized protein F4822DRAFT_419138 [Hypoxylon trugodes]|uniref:uncharacterized protein n=1 Tax=Hypoxylon trugodes TaxID=326681 RepID=UPI00219921A9|nr:uncharacterized protein F4822DRAFT_419138 [Hypoxylon trugodes]KAI1384244.1 hypothetical protein F4822DRAFT_419138 [Hypoxylon trugodes]
MASRTQLHDVDLSVRFKHGIHTVFLFVDSMKPFSDIAEQLLEVLKDRYPSGLTTSITSLEKTELPSTPNQIKFAVPKEKTDQYLSQGWKPLQTGKKETPASIGIQNNAIVAFAFVPEDADDDYEAEFTVDVPGYEEPEPEE